jgi:hypothetical protein
MYSSSALQKEFWLKIETKLSSTIARFAGFWREHRKLDSVATADTIGIAIRERTSHAQ